MGYSLVRLPRFRYTEAEERRKSSVSAKKRMPLCTEKQARASKYDNRFDAAMHMVSLRSLCLFLVSEDG